MSTLNMKTIRPRHQARQLETDSWGPTNALTRGMIIIGRFFTSSSRL